MFTEKNISSLCFGLCGELNALSDYDSDPPNKQIMPEVIILGCIYALPENRDLVRAEGPKHIPIF